MKILICTNHSYMFWQFRRELTEALLKKGEVVLSTPFEGHEEDLAALGCKMVKTKINRRGINPKTDYKLFRFYLQLLKREKPDFVITYSIKPNVYAGIACQLTKTPYFVNVQGLGTAFQKIGLAQIATLLYKVAVRKAKTTFFENEANAKEFRDRHIQKKAKQTVLHGAGINLDFFSYKPYPKNDKVHFLYLGRIMKEKGIDELFYAVRKLHEEGKEFVLDLVGFYEDSYKEEVDELVSKQIAVFHGFQSDPKPFYAAADCVVLPSYHEGMSNVLLEAAATGRPLITSNISGCKEAVNTAKNQRSGILVPVKNEEKLYEAMKYMLEITDEKRKRMGDEGRKFMERNFDKVQVVEDTMKYLFS